MYLITFFFYYNYYSYYCALSWRHTLTLLLTIVTEFLTTFVCFLWSITRRDLKSHIYLYLYIIYIYRYILAWMNNAIHLISLLWCSHAVFISHSRALGYQCIIIWYTACFSWRRRKRFRHICCVYVTDSASRCCLELTEGCLGLFSSFIFHFYSFKKQNACVSQEAFSCL